MYNLVTTLLSGGNQKWEFRAFLVLRREARSRRALLLPQTNQTAPVSQVKDEFL